MKMTAEERLRRKNEFDGNLSLGVRHFNVSTGRDAHLKRRAVEKPNYADPLTGLLREEFGVARACPLCGTDDGQLLFVKEAFRHLRCNSCGMVYVSPVLRVEHLHSFYLGEESYSQVLCNSTQRLMDWKKFQYGLDLIETYVPDRGKLLDVGCGPGVFLEAARERGWEIQGVEFNKWCGGRLRELGIEVIDVPLEEANLAAKSYTCVTLWDVLEHITNCRAFLDVIRRILVPNGMVVLQVPNINSFVSRVLHEKSATFSGDSHVNLFSAATLTRLLETAGFQMLECETIWTELGTINNYLNFEDPYFGEAGPVLDFLTPQYIHQHLLGSRLLALASAQQA